MTTNIQELVAKLIVSPFLLAELHEDMAGFAARYGVDRADAQLLRDLRMDQLHVAAMVTAHKRRTMVENAFPGTFALLRGLEERELFLACALALPRVSAPDDARALGVRLSELAENLITESCPALREMIRFETLWYELRTRPVAEVPAPPGRPALASRTALVTFDRPIAELHRRLLAGEPADGLTEEPTHYLVQAGPGSAVRISRLSAGLRGVLAACDGSATLAGLAERFALRTTDIEAALRKLAAKGFVVYARQERASR